MASSLSAPPSSLEECGDSPIDFAAFNLSANASQEQLRQRVQVLSAGLNLDQFPLPKFMASVAAGANDGMTINDLDEHAAAVAASLGVYQPDYMLLAGRLSMCPKYRQTRRQTLLSLYTALFNYVHPRTRKKAPVVAKRFLSLIQQHGDALERALRPDMDMHRDYFGLKTLDQSYLIRTENGLQELPQQMLMRVSLAIHEHDVDRVLETYSLMSQGYFTHASPTMFNAGTPVPQMSSCFLLPVPDDSIEGITKSWEHCSLISKFAGGIGMSITNVRSAGSYISGTNGVSNGIVPMLRVVNDIARYVDQGGGKRKGSIAVFLEPWHADVCEFLELKLNTGDENLRTRDLFPAMWIPDLFMKRVRANEEWSLFSPSETPGLQDVHGAEFEALYTQYERDGRAVRTVDARSIWTKILQSQIETGTPYMLFKDACNAKSNQQNLGTIRSSNLCSEIVQFSSADEIAVCNLASLALPAFVIPRSGSEPARFDFPKLHEVACVVARNLDCVIDRNFYTLPETKVSNMRHRPVGMGVQGLAHTYMKMGFAFESPEARELNKRIFATIYHAAISTSCTLAGEKGCYETFEGSPASRGFLQFDLWGVSTAADGLVTHVPGLDLDWDALKSRVQRDGLRNSLSIALMPTASTAQILGNSEGIDPLTSNLYVRNVLSGEFSVCNKYMVQDLMDAGLWSKDMANTIIRHGGSLQAIEGIPQHLKDRYKTVYEIAQTEVVDQSAARGLYVCQSQSLNLVFGKSITMNDLSHLLFRGWKRGLKTGSYYVRTKAPGNRAQLALTKAELAGTATVPSSPTTSPSAASSCSTQQQQQQAPSSPAFSFSFSSSSLSSSDESKDSSSTSDSTLDEPSPAYQRLVKTIIHSHTVVMFGNTGRCAPCRRAKALLMRHFSSQKVHYVDVDTCDPSLKKAMFLLASSARCESPRTTGTIPQIWIEGQYVGGWDDVQTLFTTEAIGQSAPTPNSALEEYEQIRKMNNAACQKGTRQRKPTCTSCEG